MMLNEYEILQEWTLATLLGEEKKVIHDIDRMMPRLDRYSDRMEDIQSVIAEACLNAFEHGNHMRADAEVRVRMMAYEKGLSFRVYDEGKGFEYTEDSCEKAASPTSIEHMPSRGWGLWIIASLADRVKTGFEKGSFYIEVQFLSKGGI